MSVMSCCGCEERNTGIVERHVEDVIVKKSFEVEIRNKASHLKILTENLSPGSAVHVGSSSSKSNWTIVIELSEDLVITHWQCYTEGKNGRKLYMSYDEVEGCLTVQEEDKIGKARFVPTTRDGHSVYFREKSTRKYLAVDKDGKVILQESDHVTDEYAWYLPPEFTEESYHNNVEVFMKGQMLQKWLQNSTPSSRVTIAYTLEQQPWRREEKTATKWSFYSAVNSQICLAFNTRKRIMPPITMIKVDSKVNPNSVREFVATYPEEIERQEQGHGLYHLLKPSDTQPECYLSDLSGENDGILSVTKEISHAGLWLIKEISTGVIFMAPTLLAQSKDI